MVGRKLSAMVLSQIPVVVLRAGSMVYVYY